MQRLWNRDATLWTGEDEASWLGWLDIIEDQIAHPIQLRGLAKEVLERGLQRYAPAGHGRIESLSGSFAHDVWQDCGLP